MGQGYEVNPEQMAQLSTRFADFATEFDAILTASQAISQDDEAYGILCAWIPAVLEGRHEAFDEMMRYGQENFTLLSEAIKSTAENYENAEEDIASDFDVLAEGLE
jgi:hypothetical protein